MREIAVHLADQLVVALERPGKPGPVRRAQTALVGPVKDVQPRPLPCQLVGQLARPVG